MATLTEQLDSLYTTTWANRKSGLADNIFDSMPFWYWMKEKGKMKSMMGGRRIEVSLRYAKSENVAWIGKGDTVGMGDMDHLTIANYPWRYLVDSIVRFMVDDQQNRSKSKILDLANSKIDTANDTLVEELETRLFGAASGEQMLGLRDIVADNPAGGTPNTLGGIDQSDNSWWRNQTATLSGVSFATGGVAAMRKMLNNTMNNLMMDRTDIIVCAQSPYEYYDADVTEQRRVVNKTLGDAGFETIQYKGVPMIWSPHCSQRMYFLNTNFLMFVYDPKMYFDMTEWKPIPNQANDRAAQIVTACNLITNRRRCQGVIHSIDTP